MYAPNRRFFPLYSRYRSTIVSASACTVVKCALRETRERRVKEDDAQRGMQCLAKAGGFRHLGKISAATVLKAPLQFVRLSYVVTRSQTRGQVYLRDKKRNSTSCAFCFSRCTRLHADICVGWKLSSFKILYTMLMMIA